MLELLKEQCPWYLAGPLMGGTVVLLQWLSNYQLGMSGAIGEVKDWLLAPRKKPNWQVFIFLGVALGAFLHGSMTGQLHGNWSHGSLDSLLGGSFLLKAAVLFLGGVIVGLGVRMGGGCTSGHGLCGVSRFSPASLIAVAVFSGTGILVTALISLLFRGGV